MAFPKREEVLFYAKLAESCERFEDMMQYMRLISKFEQQLSIEEISLFSVALKNLAAVRKTGIRSLQIYEQQEQNENLKMLITKKLRQIEFELIYILEDAIEILDQKLNEPDNQGPLQSKIRYLKIKNESLAILYELKLCSDSIISDTLDTNIKMLETAKVKFNGSDANRLIQSINLFKFYYHICKDPTKAQIVGQSAIDAALADEENITEDSIQWMNCLKGYMNELKQEYKEIS
ncbi:hypothetical protein ABPG74_000439 [Tetrahymena malaccensis]